MQPPDPATVPASAKIAVSVVPVTTLETAPLPLLTPVATQRVFVRPAASVAANVMPTLPSAVLSSSVPPLTAYVATCPMTAMNAVSTTVSAGPQAFLVAASGPIVSVSPATV